MNSAIFWSLLAHRYTKTTRPQSSSKNHGSALAQPDMIEAFLQKECSLGATCGPFAVNPLQPPLVLSLLQIASNRSGKPRVVVNLNYPCWTEFLFSGMSFVTELTFNLWQWFVLRWALNFAGFSAFIWTFLDFGFPVVMALTSSA